MAVTAKETRPRHIDNNGVRRRYTIYDTVGAEVDEAAAIAWIEANVPTEVAGFPRADYSGDELEEIHGEWNVEVAWGLPEYAGSPQEEDTLEYKFNFQAPGGLFKQSLATIAAYTHPSHPIDAEPEQYGGAINVVYDAGKLRVEGVNLSPPPESYTLSYRVGSGVITGAYQSLVRSMQGKVNSVSFRGEPAGSLMLVRTSGGRDTSGIWFIEFGFAQIENDTVPFDVGGITVTAKDGMDLLWVFYGIRTDELIIGAAPNPIYAFVERIYKRVDFNALGLP